MIRFFGTTMNETFQVLAGSTGAHLGPGREGEYEIKEGDKLKAIVRIILSLLLIFIGTFFVVQNEGNSESIGSSILGVVAGYWFK